MKIDPIHQFNIEPLFTIGHIGNQAIVGAQSGVMNDIPDGGKWLGAPAQPDKDFKRQVIALRHLPDLLKKISQWEKKLGVEE